MAKQHVALKPAGQLILGQRPATHRAGDCVRHWLRQLACRGTVGDTAELDGAVADVVIDPIVDVDSDASNDPETLPRAPACLAQHTTKLAAAEHQVVGPLEPD